MMNFSLCLYIHSNLTKAPQKVLFPQKIYKWENETQRDEITCLLSFISDSLLSRNDSMITKIIIALEEFTVLRWGEEK